MLWRTTSRTFDFSHTGAVMGVLNVTPDSFSDGGRWQDLDAAVAHAAAMLAEGAEIIDVGGESTRPGAAPVDEATELARVLPVIGRLATLPGHGSGFVISVDTMKPAVARAAALAGAGIINDVSGLRDPRMLDVIKETGAAAVVMHMHGEPQTMQDAPDYEDVVNEVRDFFCTALSRCIQFGVPADRIAFDPGIGFGKTLQHNTELLRRLPELCSTARPLVVGVSRKSFIGRLLGSQSIEDRGWPTVALTSFCRARGARVVRVHEVKPNTEALRMTEAIIGP